MDEKYTDSWIEIKYIGIGLPYLGFSLDFSPIRDVEGNGIRLYYVERTFWFQNAREPHAFLMNVCLKGSFLVPESCCDTDLDFMKTPPRNNSGALPCFPFHLPTFQPPLPIPQTIPNTWGLFPSILFSIHLFLFCVSYSPFLGHLHDPHSVVPLGFRWLPILREDRETCSLWANYASTLTVFSFVVPFEKDIPVQHCDTRRIKFSLSVKGLLYLISAVPLS